MPNEILMSVLNLMTILQIRSSEVQCKVETDGRNTDICILPWHLNLGLETRIADILTHPKRLKNLEILLKKSKSRQIKEGNTFVIWVV